MLDFLIVGQGIAGSVLALTLSKRGYKIAVIDQPELSSSSRVAGGVWNPVVFKRLTKSWMADELVPSLYQFYQNFEKESGRSFMNERLIIKPFTEEQEKILWQKKAATENTFLDSSCYENLATHGVNPVLSYSHVLRAGNIDLSVFLPVAKSYLQEKGHTVLTEAFEYDDLEIKSGSVKYHSLEARYLVFCEGHRIKCNPWFKDIPMKPAKGETLTIHCPGLELNNSILNKGVFIMPLGNQVFKVGATYEWTELNDEPTLKGKEELQRKLELLINLPYAILDHNAGVRPSVIDRRPVLGAHPDYPHLLVFNGLGTKGVMLAPYFAEKLVDAYNKPELLDKEFNVSRFY